MKKSFQIQRNGAISVNTGKTYKTRQRECILECIRKKADAYITIQQLSEELEKQNRKVGLTTIYRTLDRLEAEKAIARSRLMA